MRCRRCRSRLGRANIGTPSYTAHEMHAYARAALAQRQQAAPSAQAEQVAWRITTVGGRIFFEDKPLLSCYTQEWLDRCREVTPLYAAPPAAQAEPQEPLTPMSEQQVAELIRQLGFAQLSPTEVIRAYEAARGIGKQESK